MAADLYDDIRDDLKYVADELEDEGFEYKSYKHGTQFNAKDKDGIIHSFYPTTGTTVFNRSNNREDHVKKIIYDGSLNSFMNYLNNPEFIQKFWS